MQLNSEFKNLEFFRKIRDEQAALLSGKNHEDIIAFFSSYSQNLKPSQAFQPTTFDKTMAGVSR